MSDPADRLPMLHRIGSAPSGDGDVDPDASASTGEELLARGLARMSIGRDREARSDFEAAVHVVGDAAMIELAHLDIRIRSKIPDARRVAEEIRARAGGSTPLLARSLHVLGLAKAKLRDTASAIEDLVEALAITRALGLRRLGAQVLDTLGAVHASRGRDDYAMSYFAQSIANKAIEEDAAGMGITLGNMGRTHLRAGRCADARECFELDLRIAAALGDDRGIARMLDDLGRVALEAGDLDEAERRLDACIELAKAKGFADTLFFAKKDLSLVLLRQERLDESRKLLGEAESAASESAPTDPYFEALLRSARGEWYLAHGDRDAIGELKAAVRQFERADFPDLVIANLVLLARAIVRFGGSRAKDEAERCLGRALQRAKSEGHPRHVRKVLEAIAGLDVTIGLTEERGRLAADPSHPPPPNGYSTIRELGGGAFGTVIKAHDPLHNEIVAIKLLNLDELWNAERRAKVLQSARMELEVASKIRHPGIGRVLRLGEDDAGRTYVVQEFIDGMPLRSLMHGPTGESDLARVLETTGRIAEALAALHREAIVHRDLKPENVMLRGEGDSFAPVLIDFGIAHYPDGPECVHGGTLGYMAPEQGQTPKVDGRADVYALGVILFEWLTGVLPIRFRSSPDDVKACIEELRKRKPDAVDDFRRDLAPDLVELVGSMLEKKPSKRPSAEAIGPVCARMADSIQRKRPTRTL